MAGACTSLARTALCLCRRVRVSLQLVLNHMHMGGKEAVPLALALENNQALRSLDLSHNDLDDRAAVALGNSLGVRHQGVTGEVFLGGWGSLGNSLGVRHQGVTGEVFLGWGGGRGAGRQPGG